MMDRSQRKQTGWPQRLQDWEATAPARPGEGPAPDFWDRLEPDLPASPGSGPRRPFWLWGTLVLLLLTHFTCFQSELGYFPLPQTVVATSGVAHPSAEEVAAIAMPEEITEAKGNARPEPRSTEKVAVRTESNGVLNETTVARRGPRKTEGANPAGARANVPEAIARGASPKYLITQTLPSRPGAAQSQAGLSFGYERLELAGPEPRWRGLNGQTTPASTTSSSNAPREPHPAEDAAIAIENNPVPDETLGARREPRKTGVQVWAGPHYAPVSNRTRLTLDPGVLTARRTRQTLAPELGLNLYLQFGEHWGLRTGFTSTQVQTESQYRFIRFFNPQFEAPNTAGDGLSKYSVDVASAYTKSSAEVELLRPRDRMLQNGARLRIDLRIRETVSLQSIPLQLTYGQRWGRFALSAQLGPEWTTVSVRDFAAGARVQQPGLQTNRVRIQSRERISRSTYWSLSGGLAATYSLGDRWRIGLTPEFTTSLENLSARPEFSARNRSAGVRLEVAYRLAGPATPAP